jgi:iron(II)-dependent oxidoreductase
VTNREYLAFVAAGGKAPAYWKDGRMRRFDRWIDLALDEPVMHVSARDAEAYCAWAGRRLPSEAEWEKAASWDPAGRKLRYPWGDESPSGSEANLGGRRFAPAPAGACRDGVSPCGALQMVGDVWEWTSSDFTGYPGFQAFPYREYSEVFFGGEYKVLRGGSWGTHRAAIRTTFRNWDYPIRRQLFAGFRCARDA